MSIVLFPNSLVCSQLIITRSAMLQSDECARLLFGAEDGFEGVLVDQFGEFIVGSVFNPEVTDSAADFLKTLENAFPTKRILIRVRRAAAETEAAGFEYHHNERFDFQDLLVAQENKMRFEIRCNPEHDFGIFLDAASARSKVTEISAGLHVLNLFSYTCGFGVAACLGKAASVTNIDPNRDYLAWGKANAALNNVDFKILPDTAQEFLGKHLRRMERGTATHFDLIIIDPPAFGVGRGADRLLRLLWPQIFSAVLQMKPKHVLLMCNDKYFRTRKNFEDMVLKELGGLYSFAEVAQTQKTRTNHLLNRADAFYVEPNVFLGTLTESL